MLGMTINQLGEAFSGRKEDIIYTVSDLVPAATDEGLEVVYTVPSKNRKGVGYTLWVVHPDSLSAFYKLMTTELGLSLYQMPRGGYVSPGGTGKVHITK